MVNSGFNFSVMKLWRYLRHPDLYEDEIFCIVSRSLLVAVVLASLVLIGVLIDTIYFFLHH
jgi:hypothetical protein